MRLVCCAFPLLAWLNIRTNDLMLDENEVTDVGAGDIARNLHHLRVLYVSNPTVIQRITS